MKKLFNFFADKYFHRVFQNFIKQHAGKSIFIFDIDNTIAHTYPSLLNQYNSEAERHLSLQVFPSMQQLTSAIERSPSRCVLFLTARSYKMYRPTLQWLQQNGFPAAKQNVVVVPDAKTKLRYIESVLPLQPKLWLIDDMSYHHEHGEVKFYDNEIRLLLKMPLRYIGYQTIRRFQNKIK
ncbi:MAG: hypothetical protein KIS94_07545 [Chitinophagales bacterium]|nr:hypothetical protein [Chitinophagales bacterium]